MNKILIALCITLICSWGAARLAEADSVTATFFIDGVILDLGEISPNPKALVIVYGSPDNIVEIVKPPYQTTTYFDPAVDFFFDYDPTIGISIVFLPEDSTDPSRIFEVTLGSDTIRVPEILENQLFSIPIGDYDTVGFLTVEGQTFWISQIIREGLTVSFETEVIPEPSTLLLLGLGLLGLVGVRKWPRNKKRGVHRTMVLFFLIIFVGMPSVVSANPGNLVWINPYPIECVSGVTTGTDGTIYVGGRPVEGSTAYSLYAINPNGNLKWRYETGSTITAIPTIATDGTVYIGTQNGTLYAIKADGSLKWEKSGWSGNSFSLAIAADGTLYIGNGESLYAVNPENGNQEWGYSTGANISSSPVIGADGTIYVSSGSSLHAINLDGSLKWSSSSLSPGGSSPAVAADGTIYVRSYDRLYALNPDGELKWQYLKSPPASSTIGTDSVHSPPIIGTDGTIYLTSRIEQPELFGQSSYISIDAINPNSTKKWEWGWGTSGSFLQYNDVKEFSSSVIGADGTIYGGISLLENELFYDYNVLSLYAIDPETGALKWQPLELFRQEPDGDASLKLFSPTIGANGTIYLSSSEGLFALEGDSGWTYEDYTRSMLAYADSPWPSFGQNNFNFRRVSTTGRYFAWDQVGGLWGDNKTPDGSVVDDLCWAAAASNILAWGGWGTPVYDTAEKIFQNFTDNWTNAGGLMSNAWQWWIDGTAESPYSEVLERATLIPDGPGGGNYWSTDYDFFEVYDFWGSYNSLQGLEYYLLQDYGVSITAYQQGEYAGFPSADYGHAFTTWGYDYDDAGLFGIWVTDSDSAETGLSYHTVTYDDEYSLWYLTDYGEPGENWYIGGIYALQHRPFLLTVRHEGTDSGIVTSNPAGIVCGNDCGEAYETGTKVILSATPSDGSTFTGWSGGGCYGTGVCLAKMQSDVTITATFGAERFPEWTATGAVSNSERSAGDVNGDGYDDVMIITGSNTVSVYHGSNGGLSNSRTWSAGGLTGDFQRAIGDVNGDGYDDVILLVCTSTSRIFDPIIVDPVIFEQTTKGHARLYYGSKDGLSSTFQEYELWTKTKSLLDTILDWIVELILELIGKPSDDNSDYHFQVSTGNVNGDTYDDMIVLIAQSALSVSSGKLQVYHGSENGLSSAGLYDLGTCGSIGFQICDDFQMRAVGDINGDGNDDVITTETTIPTIDNVFEIEQTSAAIFYGGAGSINNWPIQGPGESVEFVFQVSSAGDVNGDGKDDVIVNTGETALLYYGAPAGVHSTPDWMSRQHGILLGIAGDVNGDGYADLVGKMAEEEVVLYRVSATGLDAIPSWRIPGSQARAAGDVNGDGYDDLIVGDPPSVYYGYFSPSFPILVKSSDSGGHISPEPIVTVNQGEDQTFTIMPESGYQIETLLIDNIDMTKLYQPDELKGTVEYTFEHVLVGHTIEAQFMTIERTIAKAFAGPYGTIEPAGEVTVPWNTPMTFTIMETDPVNHPLHALLVDGDDQKADCSPEGNGICTYTLEWDGNDHTIEALFLPEDQMVTITASAGPGGRIFPEGRSFVQEEDGKIAVKAEKTPNANGVVGEGVVWKIIPDPGYRILNVFVDGVSEGPATKRPFPLPGETFQANREIGVRFVEKSARLAVVKKVCYDIDENGTELEKTECTDDFNGIFLIAKNRYKLTQQALDDLTAETPPEILTKLGILKDMEYATEKAFLTDVEQTIGIAQTEQYKTVILQCAEYDADQEGFVVFPFSKSNSVIIEFEPAGDAELLRWETVDGTELHGIIYVQEDIFLHPVIGCSSG